MANDPKMGVVRVNVVISRKCCKTEMLLPGTTDHH